MNLATNLFLAYMIYFILTYIKLFTNKEHREQHKSNRKKLDKLRSIAIKTPEQQREFINLKYPKTPPFKWTIMNVLKMLFKLISIISIFIGVRYLYKTYINYQFKLWFVMLFVIIFPLLLNKILKKYNLEQDDLSVFFGGKKK